MTEQWNQNALRARFCHALSEMYKSDVPLYGDLVDVVWEADAKAIQCSQSLEGKQVIDPDDILPSRHRVERHGAIRLGTPQELSTIRRMFAVMGMYPVGYYDLGLAGFPMHTTAFRPKTHDALAEHPMDLLTERTRDLAQQALKRRNIFTPRLLSLLELVDTKGSFSPAECSEFITNGLETFRWHSKATVSLEEYQMLKAEHPLIADVVSFPSSHINHLTPRTVDIDLVQQLMVDRGMPAKERIEGPPKRDCPILLRQTSFKALEETVYFHDTSAEYGRQLYDKILDRVNAEAAKNKIKGNDYEILLEDGFKEFPDTLPALRDHKLAYFCYRVTPKGEKLSEDGVEFSNSGSSSVPLQELLDQGVLTYEPLTYEDFLPLSAGGIFNSNLGNLLQSKQLIMSAEPDLDGFQRSLGCLIADEFHLYAEMEANSLEACRGLLGLERIDV
ncbi:hypothetical protein N7486_000312 [Penicillium sp. IBT 16267x]|nr:hypothetical protein N7486_000312 [Penicillium sp. IBT 16267x]